VGNDAVTAADREMIRITTIPTNATTSGRRPTEVESDAREPRAAATTMRTSDER
jgi:hypothetical protein